MCFKLKVECCLIFLKAVIIKSTDQIKISLVLFDDTLQEVYVDVKQPTCTEAKKVLAKLSWYGNCFCPGLSLEEAGQASGQSVSTESLKKCEYVGYVHFRHA